MNYWVLSDNHFGHRRIHEEQYGGRPIGFEEQILANVAKLVEPNDILLDLGDVAIYQQEYWHDRYRQACRGKMLLQRGNHDRHTLSWYYDRGWDCVADMLYLKIYGKQVLLSHRPSNLPCDINVHGHWHNPKLHPEIANMPNHRLVSIEHHYSPLKLRSLVEGGHKCG